MSPRYHSKDGVWYPAKEKVALTDHKGKEGRAPGEPYIYEGPDRAAEFELFKKKVQTLGRDFRKDVDFINRVRQLGYENIDDYLKDIGYDKEKVEKDFEEKASSVTKHELPETKQAVQTMGGGKDTSGQGNDAYGGFGKPEDAK